MLRPGMLQAWPHSSRGGGWVRAPVRSGNPKPSNLQATVRPLCDPYLLGRGPPSLGGEAPSSNADLVMSACLPVTDSCRCRPVFTLNPKPQSGLVLTLAVP